MKKFLSFTLALCLSVSALADCDFSSGITKLPNGNFEYSKDCHIRVGEMKQDLEIAKQQNEKYVKALELKDLALSKSDQRIQLWMDTSFKLEDRIETIDKMRNTNQWISFGLGALTVIGAGMMAAQLIK